MHLPGNATLIASKLRAAMDETAGIPSPAYSGVVEIATAPTPHSPMRVPINGVPACSALCATPRAWARPAIRASTSSGCCWASRASKFAGVAVEGLPVDVEVALVCRRGRKGTRVGELPRKRFAALKRLMLEPTQRLCGARASDTK